MKDGEVDFSKYTHEQIGRSLSRIDREKYPLNYANLLAAQRALPTPDNAQLESLLKAEFLDAILNGKTSLSSPWTLATNALCGLAPAVASVWVATHLVASWTSLTRAGVAILLLVGSLLGVLGVRFLTLKRAVVRDDTLEIHGFLRRPKVPLADIDRVRWNDTQGFFDSRHLAVIEIRGESGKNLRVSLLPHSIAIMRAFAAHVGVIQGRTDVADPAYVSTFYLGSGIP